MALSLLLPATANAQVYVSLVAPPLLPVYEQPQVTAPNSIWTPGYWAWGPEGYYWVPGTYVQPPSLGMYWTPGYWGENSNGAGYAWNAGYWAPNVGYYGGINYGGGYYGNGYVGGAWYNNAFRYNTAVTPVDVSRIRNVYVNRTVVVRNVNRYSYNGPGGVRMYPNAQQRLWMREHHVGLTPVQRAHIEEAQRDRNLYAKYNGGRPNQLVATRPLSATNRPKDFKPIAAAPAKPAANKPQQMHPNAQPHQAPAHQAAPHQAPPHQATPQHQQPPAAHAQAKPPAQKAPQEKAPAQKPPSAQAPQMKAPEQKAPMARPPEQRPQQQQRPPQAKATKGPAI